MGLSAGTLLGPYEITSPIGAGGMGEVYKARDTRLDRSVAIKVLSPEFSADPDRRARFEREAKTIAGLNHPHICTLYDVGEHDGATFLVMEHLTGDTLAARLEKGQLPLEQALIVATEIADALTAAHRQGVIHRDLKPGNVMLTKSGTKLLDFGLARLTAHGEQPAAAGLASAPTQTRPLTSEGAIVGTLPYMAPEQVEGKPADARSDLWALGAILYEMLTGKRAFEGRSAATLIAAILDREPVPISSFQTLPGVDPLVHRCLAKNPEERWDSAHDLAFGLRGIREASGVPTLQGAGPRRRWTARAALWAATGGVLLFVAGGGTMGLLRPAPSVAADAVSLSPAEELNAGGTALTPGGSGTALTWAGGQTLVFVGQRAGVQQLYVRRFDAEEARPLSDTKDAQVPAVSTDGQRVAFWADSAIRQVPVGGGPVADRMPGVETPRGLVWDDRGSLFFGNGKDGRIWQIPAEGAPQPVTTVRETEMAHTLPWPLPDGRAILYTVRRRQWSWGDEEVVAQPLPVGDPKPLLADARYVRETGHLVFLRQGRLFAVPFDAARLEVHGEPVPLRDGVAQALTARNNNDVTGAGQFAISKTGRLAWVPSPVVDYPKTQVVTVDRVGNIAPLGIDDAPGRVFGLRVSRDSRWLAMAVMTVKGVGIRTYDRDRGSWNVVDTGKGEATWPVWSPDGRRLYFRWVRNGRWTLASSPADDTASPQVVLPGGFFPTSVTETGQVVAVTSPTYDIVIVDSENGPARLRPLVSGAAFEGFSSLSPDGRWLAYVSDKSERREVYITSYPGRERTYPVSTAGGSAPAWNPNGSELFFVIIGGPPGKIRMMAVDFAPGSVAPVGRARPVFDVPDEVAGFLASPVRGFDVAGVGERLRFYVARRLTPPAQPRVDHINLIQNFFEELKAKVPAGR